MKLRSGVKQLSFADLSAILAFCEKESLSCEKGSQDFLYYSFMADHIKIILLSRLNEYVEFGSAFQINKPDDTLSYKPTNSLI